MTATSHSNTHRTNNTVIDHDTIAAVSTRQHFYSSGLLSKSRAPYYHKTKRGGSGAMGKYDLYHKAFLELAKDGRFLNKWGTTRRRNEWTLRYSGD